MKLLTLFILFPLLLSAQDNSQAILGTWIKTKAEMKDGSRIVDRKGGRTAFVIYGFDNKGVVGFATDPLQGFDLSRYKINDSIINIGTTSYQIIKLTKDSLIIQENDKNLADNQIPTYYFANIETHKFNDKPVYENTIQDSVYNITDYIFPHPNGALKIITNDLNRIKSEGQIKISFIIDKNGILKNLLVVKNDGLSKHIEKEILTEFEKTKTLWFPGRVNDKSVSVSLDIILKFKKSEYMFGWMSIITHFSPPPSIYKDLTFEEIEKEKNAFNKGVSLAKENKYDEALIQFTKCLKIDEINLDAYYLRAAINLKIGNKKAACDDWNKLAQLGQVPAIKCLAKYCEN